MIDVQGVLTAVISLILGGGLFKGIDSLRRGIAESREKRALAEQVGAKTPVEIESISVGTMERALLSAQSRIKALEDERDRDREYNQRRIEEMEEQQSADKEYYQGRVKELTEQLEAVRKELTAVEKKLAQLVTDMHTATEGDKSS